MKVFKRLLIGLALVFASTASLTKEVFASWTAGHDDSAFRANSVNQDFESEDGFAVAYVGSKYYATIDAAFQDHSSTSANATSSATITIIPTETILSTFSLDRTKKETFERINAAKTLTQSVTLGTNKTVILSFNTSSSVTADASSSHTNFADSSASAMGTNMKNYFTLGENVQLTFPSSSTFNINAKLAQFNTGLVSTPTSEYAQLNMKRNSSIVMRGTFNCYGFVRETYDAKGTTNIYLEGTSSSNVTLKAPVTVYNAIGGTASSNARSSKVFPYNMFGIVNINSTVHVNYYSTIVIHFYFKSSSYSTVNTTCNLVSKNTSNSMFILENASSSVTFRHDEDLFISAGECERKDGSNYINLLERVSATTVSNSKKKTYITLTGSVKIGRLQIDVGLTVDTNDFYLPLSYEYDITLAQGATFTNDYRLCFLAGAKFTVKKNATLNLNNHTLFLTKRKSIDGYTLIGYGNAAVQQYPYGTTTEDALDEVACETYNAKLYNAGTVNINKGFGGKIYSYDESFADGNNSKIVVGNSFVNIGTSTAANSNTCPRFYSITSALSTYNFYQSNAYAKIFDGSGLEYEVLSPGTYVPYRDGSNYGWAANTATIQFITNGADQTIPNKDIEIVAGGYLITSSDLPATNPTKPHYTFAGWYLDPECTTPFHDVSVYVSTYIYAKWTPITYNIVYHCDEDSEGNPIGGTPTNNNPTTYDALSSIPLEAPTYLDLVFDGWYLNSNYTNRVSMVNGNILDSLSEPYDLHLYGRWYPSDTETFTITYSNSNTDEGCTCVASEDILSVNISSYAAPNLSGKNNNTEYPLYFEGWYLDSEFNTKYTSTSQITGSTTLYAHWIEKNTINIHVYDFLQVRYLAANVNFTIPNAANYAITATTGYEIMWRIGGGLLDGNSYRAGDVICLSNTFGQTIDVTMFESPLSYSISSVSVGSNESAVVKVYRNNTVIWTSSSLTGSNNSNIYTVQSGDEIEVTVSADSGYTKGSTTVNGATSLGNDKYKVDKGQNVTISIANATKNSSGCLLPTDLVTMADGTQKEIQYVEPGEMIAVFNHETGQIDFAPVTFNERDDYAWWDVIHLEFSNGSKADVVSEHGFFDLDTMRYEYIDTSNYQEFIGHRFYAINNDFSSEEVTLVNAYVSKEYTDVYELPSFYHLNFIADGILSMPGGIKGLFNIFDYGEDLKYDEEAYNRDIETYGLFTYEDLAPLGVTEIMFEAYAGKYLKVALGKGILTEEYLAYLIERYGGFTEEEP